MQGDAVRDSGPCEVSPRALRILRVAVRVDHAALIAHSLRPPDSRIADSGAQFKYGAGVDHQSQLLQNARHGWANDRDLVLRGIILHLGEYLVTLGQHGVQVVIDRSRRGEVVMAPTGSVVFLL